MSNADRHLAADTRVDPEPLTQEIGRSLLGDVHGHRAHLLSARFWSDRLMNWAMEDPEFKAALFRFVDVFPMLRGGRQVHEYLVDYLDRPGVKLPWGVGFGLKAAGAARALTAKTVGRQIEAMAGNFIAGKDATAALPRLKKLWDEGIAFSVDLLGEACVSDAEAGAYQQRYLDLIDALPQAVAVWPANEQLEHDHLGAVPRTNVSIKISSLSARTDPIAFDRSVDVLVEALGPILQAAGQRGVLVNFDMEQFALKDLTLALFMRCCEQHDFPAGLAMQSYLRSGEEDARRVIEWARSAGRQVTVRLIKGAYWDYEVIHAETMGWPPPVWVSKGQTDACFERMAEAFVGATPRSADEGGVKLALGSHNVRSLARVLALLALHDLPESAVEIQMLFGMADPIKAAILRRRLRLREYVPVGAMIPGMAYLVRRLLENTSNQSWLRAGFAEDVSDEELLASPHKHSAASETAIPPAPAVSIPATQAAERLDASPDEHSTELPPFCNEPNRDFSQAEQRERFAAAIRTTDVPVVSLETGEADVDRAVAAAVDGLPDWADADPAVRAQIIRAAAGLLRQRRDELSGVIIRESGKTWREADADVCEAIDFCEFYARQSIDLFARPRLGRFVGEWNEHWHQARGVAAVISPWNFPLAICCGMTSAALVTGNAAVVKPAEQSCGIARIMCEILWEAGVPRGALHFLPGRGELVGAGLVRHPGVALIAFTGSKLVGLDILQTAPQNSQQRGFVKKVVCEMGGKNAIIIDESADLDEAVLGVRASTFGYSGQKCSACSRAIVVDSVYDQFLERLVESTKSLVIGDPLDPATHVGPVIDREAAEKIRGYIAVGQEEGTLVLACPVPSGLEETVGKPFAGPHIFTGIEPHHRLANEEVFGPVLAVMRAKHFEQALAWANATAYKLTGGVYSRSPSHLEAARQRFRVGNLYLNRGITGALVGRQPFGGFGLSGTGTKAGGAEYLSHFVEPRACTENTMRHGFAPGLESS